MKNFKKLFSHRWEKKLKRDKHFLIQIIHDRVLCERLEAYFLSSFLFICSFLLQLMKYKKNLNNILFAYEIVIVEEM